MVYAAEPRRAHSAQQGKPHAAYICQLLERGCLARVVQAEHQDAQLLVILLEVAQQREQAPERAGAHGGVRDRRLEDVSGASRARAHAPVGRGRAVKVGKDALTWFLRAVSERGAKCCCCSTQRAHAPDPQAREPLSLWTEVWPTQPVLTQITRVNTSR